MSGDPMKGVEGPQDALPQSVLVTGAARGLGRAIVTRFVASGARVVACDVLPAVLDLPRDVPGVHTVEAALCDVSVAEEVEELVAHAVSLHGRIDVVVNNAAVMERTPVELPLGDVKDTFEKILGTNLGGVYNVGRSAMGQMLRQQDGHIINIATDHLHHCGWPVEVAHPSTSLCPWSAERRRPGVAAMDAYDASKWGVMGLTQAWAQALRNHGVRVNAVCMGATDTPMLREAVGHELGPEVHDAADVAEVLYQLADEGPQGRSGDSIGIWAGHPARLTDDPTWLPFRMT